MFRDGKQDWIHGHWSENLDRRSPGTRAIASSEVQEMLIAPNLRVEQF